MSDIFLLSMVNPRDNSSSPWLWCWLILVSPYISDFISLRVLDFGWNCPRTVRSVSVSTSVVCVDFSWVPEDRYTCWCLESYFYHCFSAPVAGLRLHTSHWTAAEPATCSSPENLLPRPLVSPPLPLVLITFHVLSSFPGRMTSQRNIISAVGPGYRAV